MSDAITEDGKCDALAEVEALRAEIARLRSALNDVANVPPDTVMTALLMRNIAKNAIATEQAVLLVHGSAVNTTLYTLKG